MNEERPQTHSTVCHTVLWYDEKKKKDEHKRYKTRIASVNIKRSGGGRVEVRGHSGKM